ncbi:DsbA family oxidoreductase [Brevibacillus marinus]|uniref:DsbA family oxidoreductase n=1 Tax=Brevibacillus marinus TaxID=2496837 RepID=UPI000F83F501|nr:DsbA family oxidoreductase [Brevibacillus marinus]
MIVEIWSDFVCPFCYIGKRRFEAALERFAHKQEVTVVYRSFELDPHAEREQQRDVHDLLAAKYGMSRAQAKAMNEQVAAQARSVGLTYHMDTIIPTNTFDAHRLAHFAARQGKMNEMTERLLRAYFTDSRHIGDQATLAELAAEVGLEQTAAAQVLAGDQFAQEVRRDEEEAARLGIHGVPFFLFNRTYAITGAQPSELFREALEKAWAADRPPTSSNNPEQSAAAACVDGACSPAAPKQEQ